MERNTLKVFVTALILLSACRQNTVVEPADFVFSTDNIDGDESYYSKPVVITGNIDNHDVYPNVTDISITVPFYDRVDNKQRSVIFNDKFGFTVLPYAPRTVSMLPYIDHIVLCPGDSIHIELDFADLGNVTFSGSGAENNVKMNQFHTHYSLNHDWPGSRVRWWSCQEIQECGVSDRCIEGKAGLSYGKARSIHKGEASEQ